VLIGLGFFTAGLLRRFNTATPVSPYVTPLVGSFLFAAVFVLLLVSAREWRVGPSPGPGLRIGTVTPILLMLLIAKWVSTGLYEPLFTVLSQNRGDPAELDARYRAFAAAGLLLTCLIVANFSPHTRRRTWKRLHPALWLRAAVGTAAVVTAIFVVLGGLSWALGGGLRLRWPPMSSVVMWVLAGQAFRALAEETYYRGLIMGEMQRLAPRLGLGSSVARRWCALLPAAGLFAMEHLTLGPPWDVALREALFVFALGVLLGVLVLVTENLHFAAGIHAWINCLLLGAVPRFVDVSGQDALPSGAYVGLSLSIAFVLAFAVQQRARGARLTPSPTVP
jgi:hypothetical protein